MAEEYDIKHKYTYAMLLAGHRAIGDIGFKARMALLKGYTYKYAFLIVHDKDTRTFFYVSADDFTKYKENPEYEFGVLHAGDKGFELVPLFRLPKIPKTMYEIKAKIDELKDGYDDYDETLKIYRDLPTYFEWLDSMGYEPYFRRKWNKSHTAIIKDVAY